MAEFIQSDIKYVSEGDVIFTKDDIVKADSLYNHELTSEKIFQTTERNRHMYKDVFDKEISWLDEEIDIIEKMLKDETTPTKEYVRLQDKRIFAIEERARLYAWLSEVKSTATHHENTGNYQGQKEVSG